MNPKQYLKLYSTLDLNQLGIVLFCAEERVAWREKHEHATITHSEPLTISYMSSNHTLSYAELPAILSHNAGPVGNTLLFILAANSLRVINLTTQLENYGISLQSLLMLEGRVPANEYYRAVAEALERISPATPGTSKAACRDQLYHNLCNYRKDRDANGLHLCLDDRLKAGTSAADDLEAKLRESIVSEQPTRTMYRACIRNQLRMKLQID